MAAARHTISAKGTAEAEAELKHLTEVRRPEIVQSIKTAREFGDLKENAEYHAAREAQGMNESRIRVLEHHLATAVVSVGTTGGGEIEVGSAVTYRDTASGKDTEVTIVHPLEADLAAGKLSAESPIGAALLGAGKGDSVSFETPRGGVKELEVLEIG
jgi:transcription elongation factor GreA